MMLQNVIELCPNYSVYLSVSLCVLAVVVHPSPDLI